ncbi:MAG: molybdate ABC transporter permease subunit [Verrucomicrobiota bacterium]|nr:molybdate ABC transporter permease subunit [Verrucomicrobiota bacterium]
MDSEAWLIIRFTLGMAALSTLLVTPIGTVTAWLLAKKRWPGKSLVETLIFLPLVIPPVATGLLLLKVFSRNGLLGGFLTKQLGLEVIFTWRAVVIAMVVMAFPLFVRTARVAFEAVPVRLEQVGRTLGASPLRVWFTITLPLARNGILAGMVMGFARALGEFGATILVAGNIPGKTTTIAVVIYNNIQLGQDEIALMYVLVSIIIAFICTWVGEYLCRRP